MSVCVFACSLRDICHDGIQIVYCARNGAPASSVRSILLLYTYLRLRMGMVRVTAAFHILWLGFCARQNVSAACILRQPATNGLSTCFSCIHSFLFLYFCGCCCCYSVFAARRFFATALSAATPTTHVVRGHRARAYLPLSQAHSVCGGMFVYMNIYTSTHISNASKTTNG